MEILIILAIIVFIIVIFNNKGKSNLKKTISLVLDDLDESTIKSIAIDAISLSQSGTQSIKSSIFAFYFTSLIIIKICTFAKNGSYQPHDVRNVASIILGQTYFCLKLHEVYLQAVNYINSTRCDDDSLLRLNYFELKDSIENIAKNFG